MVYNYLIGYLATLAVGVGIGVVCTRSYFKKKYSDEAERLVALEKSKHIAVKEDIPEYESEDEEPEEEEEEHPTYETGERYIQHTMGLDKYHDYTQHYATDIPDVANDYPNEDAYLEEIGREMTEEHKNLPGPRIMSWEEIGSRPDLDEVTLVWHVDEGWMETEDGEKIDDPSSLVGECLVEPTDECPSGFLASSRQTINIINERRGSTYEVTKVRGRSYY